MKKQHNRILTFLLSLLLVMLVVSELSFPVHAVSEEIIDEYTGLATIHYAMTGNWPDGGATNCSARGQTFNQTKTTTYKLTTVSFMLEGDDENLITGNITAWLFNLTGAAYGSGQYPDGDFLAQSDNVSASTLTYVPFPYDPLPWVNFTFSGANQYILQPNSQYGIGFTLLDTNITAGTTAATGRNTTGSVHAGNAYSHLDSSWGASTADQPFIVYGELYVAPIVPLTFQDRINNATRTITLLIAIPIILSVLYAAIERNDKMSPETKVFIGKAFLYAVLIVSAVVLVILISFLAG